jgi:hypothetical protein
MKAAHQALILDGAGSISFQNNASAIVLSSNYIRKLAKCETSTGSLEDHSSSSRLEKTLGLVIVDNVEQLRQRGDFALYRYFFRNISSWKIVSTFFCLILLVVAERLPSTYLNHHKVGTRPEPKLTRISGFCSHLARD